MEKLIELLKGVRDDIAFRECSSLVDNGILDSFDIVEIVSLINEEYDIKIPAIEIVPENFNSVDAILNMIQRLQEE